MKDSMLDTWADDWTNSRYYLLDRRRRLVYPVPFRDWTIQPIEVRRVGEDRVGDCLVSTVFLGLDHAGFDGPPLLFETMVFARDPDDGPGDAEDAYTERYTTWEEAEAGHARIVGSVLAREAYTGDAAGSGADGR